jgi:hypothetical protein
MAGHAPKAIAQHDRLVISMSASALASVASTVSRAISRTSGGVSRSARLSGDLAGVFVTRRKNPLRSKHADKTVCKCKSLKLLGPGTPDGPTTQSCANPVSWRQGNSLYLPGALAPERQEQPVSVARNSESPPKIQSQSSTSENLFPAEICRADRDRFDCRREMGSGRHDPRSAGGIQMIGSRTRVL